MGQQISQCWHQLRRGEVIQRCFCPVHCWWPSSSTHGHLSCSSWKNTPFPQTRRSTNKNRVISGSTQIKYHSFGPSYQKIGSYSPSCFKEISKLSYQPLMCLVPFHSRDCRGVSESLCVTSMSHTFHSTSHQHPALTFFPISLFWCSLRLGGVLYKCFIHDEHFMSHSRVSS